VRVILSFAHEMFRSDREQQVGDSRFPRRGARGALLENNVGGASRHAAKPQGNIPPFSINQASTTCALSFAHSQGM
jgi:hypothetical protein